MKSVKRIGALMLLLTLIMSAFTFASASSTIYSAGKVSLRSGPDLDCRVITNIPANKKLTYTSTMKDDRSVTWYKVEYDGHTGWISQIYVTHSKGGNAYIGKIKLSGSEHLRYTPNKNARSIDTITAGTSLKYYATATDSRGVKWYLVHYAGDTGWVSSKNVDNGGSSSKTVRVYADKGNTSLRKSPSLDGKVITTMYQGEVAKYAGSTKYDYRGVAWYKVTYDGITGWVSSKYTTKK